MLYKLCLGNAVVFTKNHHLNKVEMSFMWAMLQPIFIL